MGTAFPFIYVISILFGIIAIIASYILHKKTKAISTLIILIGYVLAVVPLIGWLALYAFDSPKMLMEILTLIASIASPLTIIGLLFYAINIKSK